MNDDSMILKEIEVLGYVYLNGTFDDAITITHLLNNKGIQNDNNNILRFNPYSQGWCLVVITKDSYVLPIPLNYKIHISSLKPLDIENYEGIEVTREFIFKSFLACEKLDDAIGKSHTPTTKREHYDYLLNHLISKEDYTLCTYLKTQYENELDD
jgi:hypothetical protein